MAKGTAGDEPLELDDEPLEPDEEDPLELDEDEEW